MFEHHLGTICVLIAVECQPAALQLQKKIACAVCALSVIIFDHTSEYDTFSVWTHFKLGIDHIVILQRYFFHCTYFIQLFSHTLGIFLKLCLVWCQSSQFFYKQTIKHHVQSVTSWSKPDCSAFYLAASVNGKMLLLVNSYILHNLSHNQRCYYFCVSHYSYSAQLCTVCLYLNRQIVGHLNRLSACNTSSYLYQVDSWPLEEVSSYSTCLSHGAGSGAAVQPCSKFYLMASCGIELKNPPYGTKKRWSL